MSRTLVLHEPVEFGLNGPEKWAYILPGYIDEDYLRGQIGNVVVDRMLALGILTVRDEAPPQ